MKLIDKSVVVTEIEKRIEHCEKQRVDMLNAQCYTIANDMNERIGELNYIRDFLDTLEAKKVDLEKEIDDVMKQYNMIAVGRRDFSNIAKYFIELGLKIKKENS